MSTEEPDETRRCARCAVRMPSRVVVRDVNADARQWGYDRRNVGHRDRVDAANIHRAA